MFSAWDFNSWIASLAVLMFMLGLLMALGALVNALMARIWADGAPTQRTTAGHETAQQEDSVRKAA